MQPVQPQLVAHPAARPDGRRAVPAADAVQGVFQLFPFRVGGGRVPEQALLHRKGFVGQRQGCHRQHPHRAAGRVPVGLHQRQTLRRQVPGQVGAHGQLLLPGDGVQVGVPDGHLHRPCPQPVPPQPGRHLLRQGAQRAAHLFQTGQILPEGHAVAHAFQWFPPTHRMHRGLVLAPGVAAQLRPQLAQVVGQDARVRRRQLPDGADAQPGQPLARRTAHIQKIPRRQRPDDPGHVLRPDHRHGVRLFVVAAQLGEYLVEAGPHADGQAGGFAHPAADQIGQRGGGGGEQMPGMGDVQPAFVDAERLHQIGVLGVDAVDDGGKMPVPFPVGRQQHQIRAFALCLPDGLGGAHPKGLGRLVLGQDDAVAGLRVAADGHRFLFQFRVFQQLHAGVKAVAVTVQHPAVRGHGRRLPSLALL